LAGVKTAAEGSDVYIWLFKVGVAVLLTLLDITVEDADILLGFPENEDSKNTPRRIVVIINIERDRIVVLLW